jgi:outer membrane protein
MEGPLLLGLYSRPKTTFSGKEKLMRRLTLMTLGAAALLVCLLSGWAFAEAKIGVVDMRRALTESEAGKKAGQALSQRVEKMEADLKAKSAQLEKLEADFQKQSSMLSADAKRDKEKEFERKKRDLADLYRDYREEVQQAEVASFQPILKDLNAVIEKIGTDQGYTVILEKSNGVVFSAKGVNITEAAVKALNETAKKK